MWVCVFVSVHVCVWICENMRVIVGMWVCVCMYVRVNMYARACDCGGVWICVNVHVIMGVRDCGCVHDFNGGWDYGGIHVWVLINEYPMLLILFGAICNIIL